MNRYMVTLPGRVPVFDSPKPIWVDNCVIGDYLDFISLFLPHEVGKDSTDDRGHAARDDDDRHIVFFAPRIELLESGI